MVEKNRKLLVGLLVVVLITVSLMISVFSCETQATESEINLYSSEQALTAMAEKANSIKKYTDYKEGEYQEVTLNGNSITFDGTGAKVEGTNLIISEPGTYVFSGTLEDGKIIVESEADKNVKLVLDNANITCKDGTAVYVKECGKNVILSVPEGTTNSITDGSVYEEGNETNTELSAAIFSKADLVINGTGTLNVNANYKDGITSKDDLDITEVTLAINAADDGIVGKDSIVIGGGNITINAKGDGIKSTNSEDTTKGYIAIADGNFILTTGNDGIQAETTLLIADGKYEITTGEGAAAAKSSNGGMVEIQQGGMGDRQMQATTGDMVEIQQGGMGDRQMQATTGGMVEIQQGGMGDRQMQATTGDALESIPTDNMRPPAGSDDRATDNMRPPADSGDRPTDNMRPPADSGDIAIRQTSALTTENMREPMQITQEQQTTTSETTETESESIKALKAGTQIVIQAGTIAIDSQDDAIHSNGTVEIGYPNIEIATGDDGLHADTSMEIYGGEINITQSYEGIESSQITIYDGKIFVVASDDGINVAGENNINPMERQQQNATITEDSNETQTLTIKGGTINVNALGDGLDINGSGYMTGGVVTVSGSINNSNCGLDYDGVFEVTGGTLFVAGSSGMAQAPSSGTTINSIATAIDTQVAGTEISIVNSNGKSILSFIPEKEFSHIVITSSLIKSGEAYTIVAGDTELASFTANDIVTNLSGGNAGMGGRMK